MKRFKLFIEDLFWRIKNFIHQPIIPEKPLDWIILHNCSWSGRSKDGKWDYYFYGNFKTGHLVKVKR